jgi:hypothetical protein
MLGACFAEVYPIRIRISWSVVISVAASRGLGLHVDDRPRGPPVVTLAVLARDWLHRNTSQYIPPLIAQLRCRLPPFKFVASIRLQHYRPASRRSRVIYRRSLHNYMHLLQGQAWASRRLSDVTSFLFRRWTTLSSTDLDLIVGQTCAPLSQRPQGGTYVRATAPRQLGVICSGGGAMGQPICQKQYSEEACDRCQSLQVVSR